MSLGVRSADDGINEAARGYREADGDAGVKEGEDIIDELCEGMLKGMCAG